MQNLELRIFRFDSSKDYESYYKPYVYKDYENFFTLYDVFLKIADDDIYFSFEDNENSYVFVSSYENPRKEILRLSTSLDFVLEKFGKSLIIEPLSTKRAVKDFCIDKQDFLEKFNCVKNLVDYNDEIFYKSLSHLYYTSEVLSFYPKYLGDSMMYFLAKMSEKYPEKKKEFLQIASDREKGILYHIKGANVELEKTLCAFQDELVKSGFLDVDLFQPTISLPCFEAPREFQELKYDFTGFNIGFYGFNLEHKLKTKLAAKCIHYESEYKSSGYEFLAFNPDLSYEMAANIVLDAYDSGCDFLVVAEAKDFYLFDSCARKLMQKSGREFEDFYILHSSEFLALVGGERKPSLQKHALKVGFL
ncbi:hypothetical protein OQH60_05355 [Campylobacter sp. MIT 21-1685]|uniref:hypothetical protein n=1 Tax=unclassified Campylobacter TaxID=2593542 RepID=UPI00224B5ADA|nr:MULTISPECIES: hypothetical protein [unclassified Campylobacter]MCX2683234.1 hypothetical protein [Campylobacter sp. MIT 21-1684]MCX2751573.1 hypothetical protein [Campylobacter sp. MIT 21-1682]MCX2807772.1 hypothetical protein [Campylobacter sp. MIT 21-1685]